MKFRMFVLMNNAWVKYTSLGLQMGITIYLGSLLGSWLDAHYPSEHLSYFKAITLFCVFGATYSAIRQVIRFSNQEEDAKKNEKK